jgi:hypothetical protein
MRLQHAAQVMSHLTSSRMRPTYAGPYQQKTSHVAHGPRPPPTDRAAAGHSPCCDEVSHREVASHAVRSRLPTATTALRDVVALRDVISRREVARLPTALREHLVNRRSPLVGRERRGRGGRRGRGHRAIWAAVRPWRAQAEGRAVRGRRRRGRRRGQRLRRRYARLARARRRRLVALAFAELLPHAWVQLVAQIAHCGCAASGGGDEDACTARCGGSAARGVRWR